MNVQSSSPVSSHPVLSATDSSLANQTDNHLTLSGVDKPRALVVFLENVGHIHGVPLPEWTKDVIDFVTEEYAKLLLRWYGAHRQYDYVIILEDDAATAPQLVDALLALGGDYVTDLLLLVHGRSGSLVGHRDRRHVDGSAFARLEAIVRAQPDALNLRMVYGVNCYGASLAQTWLRLGAQVVNGACGVNWLPEPSLSTFLRYWLRGAPFSVALMASHQQGLRWGQRIWPPNQEGQDHPRIAGSRQAIFGVRDVTIHSV
jgi:hypothetical protein